MLKSPLSSMGSVVGPRWRGRLGKPLLMVIGIGGMMLWHCESVWQCMIIKQMVGWGLGVLAVEGEGSADGATTGGGGGGMDSITGVCGMGGSMDG